MKVPSLVESVYERMHCMSISELPRLMNDVTIFIFLFFCKIFSPVRTNRHNIRCAIGQHNSSSSQCHSRHVVCKVTDLMVHCLVFSRDITRSRVIICSEMSCNTTAS